MLSSDHSSRSIFNCSMSNKFIIVRRNGLFKFIVCVRIENSLRTSVYISVNRRARYCIDLFIRVHSSDDNILFIFMYFIFYLKFFID